MTTFQGGPAAGVTLFLRRAPLFLRVVCSPEGKWDALDQLTDQPAPQETITVYRKVYTGGVVILCGRGRGASGRFVVAEYRLHEEQPGDATARSIRAWRTWCEDRLEAMRPAEPENP